MAGRAPLVKEAVPVVSVVPKHGPVIDKLYRSHWNDLCGWLRKRYGAGPPDPEDVAQLAFEKISHLPELKSIRNLRSYLFTVAARVFIDEKRGRAVLDKYVDQQLKLHGVEVEEITPERVYSAREDFQAILDDLKGFSPKHREIVLRHRVLGQTYDEISEATGWSPAAISRCLKAAMTVVFKRASEARSRAEDKRGV